MMTGWEDDQTKLLQNMNDRFDVLFSGSGVIEAPTWDGAGGVYFTNVTAGGVYRIDLATRVVSDVAPHRKGIGGLALARNGDLVVSGRNVALKKTGGDTQVLLDGESLGRKIIGFNDLTVAPNGAVVVGALGPGAINPHAVEAHAPPPAVGTGTGAFFEVSRDGTRLLTEDIGHPNGVAYAIGGRSVYVSDSLRRCVYRFAVGSDGWSDRSIFAQFDGALPDGMAVASDGSLWLALALASEVVVLEPDGKVRTRIPTPTALTTCVHFGGEDLRTAFITSGSHTGQEAATLLALPVSVAGLPVPRADL
jgi:D-xylonolactonase